MSSLGYALLYLGWGAGVVAIICGWRVAWRVRTPSLAQLRGVGPPRSANGVLRKRRPVQGAVVMLAGASFLSLNLPWLRGVGIEGRPIVLSGWTGLDPFSAGFVFFGSWTLMMLAAVASTAPQLDGDAATDAAAVQAFVSVLAACLGAVILGNVMVQASMPEGSRLAWGAWVALAVAVATLLLCLVQHRPVERHPPPPLDSSA